jgi:hypothetical protein
MNFNPNHRTRDRSNPIREAARHVEAAMKQFADQSPVYCTQPSHRRCIQTRPINGLERFSLEMPQAIGRLPAAIREERIAKPWRLARHPE